MQFSDLIFFEILCIEISGINENSYLLRVQSFIKSVYGISVWISVKKKVINLQAHKQPVSNQKFTGQ